MREVLRTGWRHIVADIEVFLATGVHPALHMRWWGDLGADTATARGVVHIARVQRQGLASDLGLRAGDLLVVFGGAPICELDDLATVLRVLGPDTLRPRADVHGSSETTAERVGTRASRQGTMVGVGIRRLDHVQLAMPAGRESDAIAFYEGLLGITQVPKPDPLAARGGCWFEDGDLKVHLGVDADFRPAERAHPAFVVDDLRGLAAAVGAAGYDIDDDEPLDGFDRVYVSDPFGNRIELMQPHA